MHSPFGDLLWEWFQLKLVHYNFNNYLSHTIKHFPLQDSTISISVTYLVKKRASSLRESRRSFSVTYMVSPLTCTALYQKYHTTLCMPQVLLLYSLMAGDSLTVARICTVSLMFAVRTTIHVEISALQATLLIQVEQLLCSIATKFDCFFFMQPIVNLTASNRSLSELITWD